MARSRANYDDEAAKPKSDAYTGILALSLIALVASSVVLYLDYSQYGTSKPGMPKLPEMPKPGGGGAPPMVAPVVMADTIKQVAAWEVGPLEPTLPAPVPAEPAMLPPDVDGPELPRPAP